MRKKNIVTTAEDSGHHNNDIENSFGRILKGGSWKKQRIIMLMPCGTAIPPRVYLSHINMIFPPNQPVYRMLTQGMEVGEAYSQSIEGIMNHPELSTWEYLLTVEHDNMPQPDGVIKLLKRMEENPNISAISGLYWTKGAGGVCQIWGDAKDPISNYRPQPPQPGKLVECNGIGMGFALWRLPMFKDKKLRKPFFVTQAGKEGTGTQDLYFWSDAKKYGYRCAVDCDVTVGHYDFEGKFGPPDTVW